MRSILFNQRQHLFLRKHIAKTNELYQSPENNSHRNKDKKSEIKWTHCGILSNNLYQCTEFKEELEGNRNPQDVSSGQILLHRTHTFLISDLRLQGLLCWLNRDFLNLSITLLFRSWCRAGGSCKSKKTVIRIIFYTLHHPYRTYLHNTTIYTRKTEEKPELANYVLRFSSSLQEDGSASIYHGYTY